MGKNSRPVYSTAGGRLCPACGHPVSLCRCVEERQRQFTADTGCVTIWRERKGRGGKEVSVIKNLPLTPLELQLLASTLKRFCGSGGTVNQGSIEIQGDHRDKLKKHLEAQGYRVKLAGG